MPCRPRSVTVKNSRDESGSQVKLLIDRSRLSVSEFNLPVARSSTRRRWRSLSYPERVCERNAMYLPSGEYCGELSDATFGVMRRGVAAFSPVMGTTNKSLLVLI